MTTAVLRQVSEDLVRRLGERKYDMWFGPTTRFKVEGTTLRVTAQSKHVAEWIGSHFRHDLGEVARDHLGESAVVDVLVEEAKPTRPTRKKKSAQAGTPAKGRAVGASASQAKGTDKRRLDLHLPLRHRLDTFIVGESNKLAYGAARHVCETAHDDGLGPLFIYGECGLGKTHLLQGICHRFLELQPGARVRYTTGEQFTNDYILALKGGKIDDFRRRARNLDLLAIDDVHFLSNKTSTQSEFLHTLDAIDLSGSRIVMASDEHPRHLRQVNRALVSRFMAGLIARVDRPDREMRLKIIRRLATARNLRINDRAIEMIATHCISSVRDIEGAMTKLTAMNSLAFEAGSSNGEIGCVLVETLFKSDLMPSRPIRIEAIINHVCDRLAVDKGDLMGSTRHRRVVAARGLISFLARDLTTMSFPEIGRAIGRKNHSTVLTAARRISEQIEEGEVLALGDGSDPVPLRELADQFKHQIRRGGQGWGKS